MRCTIPNAMPRKMICWILKIRLKVIFHKQASTNDKNQRLIRNFESGDNFHRVWMKFLDISFIYTKAQINGMFMAAILEFELETLKIYPMARKKIYKTFMLKPFFIKQTAQLFAAFVHGFIFYN